MRRLLPLLLIAACTGGSADKSDTDTDTDDGADTDTLPTEETDEDVWDTSAYLSGEDTYDPTDTPIGDTPLDGIWEGTFTLKHFVGLGMEAPTCMGTVRFEIDGDAPMHVWGTAACDTWDPNYDLSIPVPIPIESEYGAMTGVFTAELDPTNFDEFRMTADLTAPNMPPFSRPALRAVVTGDTFAVSFDNVVQLPLVGRQGYEFSISATRTPAP